MRKKAIKKRPTMLGMTPLEVALDMAKGLYELGAIDAITMREYERLCLPEIETPSAKKIKSLRLREKASQPVFAQILNISPSTVKQWEQGTKRPSGAAVVLLNIVAENGLDFLYQNHQKSNQLQLTEEKG
jgi:putative transcriptional regulator